MATRSLGALTIDLIAKIGGFTEGMNQAERVADRKTREMKRKMDATAKEIDKTWRAIGKAVAAGFAGITIGSTINKILTETRAAEKEQALLAAALQATGNASGYSQQRMNAMASAMEGVTTIAAGQFNQAQTVLSGFVNIVGEQVPKALMAAADYSTRTSSDMKAAAEVVGRALHIPSVGMASLQKQGFKFSESQIEAARQLERTGKIAQAQQMVLDALNETYGGAAVAARDTFGGSIDALRNQLNSLLTGDAGSFAQAKKSIEDLTRLLGSPESRQAFESFTGWVAALVTRVAELSLEFARGIRYSDGFFDAIAKYGTANPFKTPQEQLNGLIEDLKKAEQEAQRFGFLWTEQQRASNAAQQRSLKQQIGYWQDTINTQKDREPGNAMLLANYKPRRSVVMAPDMDVKSPGKVNLNDLDGARQAADLAKKREAQAQHYLKTLNEQLNKTQHLTAYEKLMLDVKQGVVVLTGKQLDKATGLATAIDMEKEAEQTRAALLARQNDELAAQRDLLNELHGYQLELAGLGMGDKALQDMRARNTLVEQHAARLREIEDSRRNALALAADDGQRAGIEAQYSSQLETEKRYQAQSLRAFEEYTAAKRAAEGDWMLGVSKAWADYLEQSRNIYGQAQQMAQHMFQGATDAVVSFAMTGKASIGDLARSVIADFIRMQAQAQMSGLFGQLLGAFGVGGVGGNAGYGNYSGAGLQAAFGYADGGWTGPGGRYEPAGLVHKGEVVWSQVDVARAGGVGVVEAMRRGVAGYANGGLVGAPLAASRAYGNNLGAGGLQVVVNNYGNNQVTQREETARGPMGEQLRRLVIDIVSGDTAEGGRTYRAMSDRMGYYNR